MYIPPTQILREITFARADMQEDQWITPEKIESTIIKK
jgi:hypothetical protein